MEEELTKHKHALKIVSDKVQALNHGGSQPEVCFYNEHMFYFISLAYLFFLYTFISVYRCHAYSTVKKHPK